jgi:SPP1 gp7 family putative phage head morphogenesis protein
MHKLNGHKSTKKADPTSGLDDGDAIAQLLAPFYRLLLEDAFLDAAEDGIAVAFDLANPFVQTVLESLAKNIRGVAETTRQDVRDLVAKQATEGWSIEELQKQIRAKGAIASRSRALMIARTETAAGYSQGSLAAYRVSGVVKQTEWLIGPASCPECQALSGAKADLGAEFAPGITAPPLHPQCTCAISPIIATE